MASRLALFAVRQPAANRAAPLLFFSRRGLADADASQAPMHDGRHIQRNPKEHASSLNDPLRDPHDLYNQVEPEKYYEHADQTVPDDRPMDYVRTKTSEKMADVVEETKMAGHLLKDMAKDVAGKASNVLKHPVESAKEAAKVVRDRATPGNPDRPGRNREEP